MDYEQIYHDVLHLLRHTAVEQGIEISCSGWVTTESVMGVIAKQHPLHSLSFREILDKVLICDKLRCVEISDDYNYIRALFGHSCVGVNTLCELRQKTPPILLMVYTTPLQFSGFMCLGHVVSPDSKNLVLYETKQAALENYQFTQSNNDRMLITINTYDIPIDFCNFYRVSKGTWVVDKNGLPIEAVCNIGEKD